MPKAGTYKHYKGELYQVLFTATHSETLELVVVYQALYGDRQVWVRPLSIWMSATGSGEARFEFVG